MKNAFVNWYEFYYQRIVNIHQAGEEIVQQPVEVLFQHADEKTESLSIHQVDDVIVHQAGEELGMPQIFGVIPWKHHVHIFTKSKSLDEALFYINNLIFDLFCNDNSCLWIFAWPATLPSSLS